MRRRHLIPIALLGLIAALVSLVAIGRRASPSSPDSRQPTATENETFSPPRVDRPIRTEAESPSLWRRAEAALRGKEGLSPEELAAYVADSGRSAESLLAAYLLTKDMAFLREAAAAFPADPAVQAELALRSDDPAERLAAIGALKDADPDNALGPCLDSLELARTGDREAALEALEGAAGCSRFDDYFVVTQQSLEETFLLSGMPALEAKVAATLSTEFPHAKPLNRLGKTLEEWREAATAAGDAEEAARIANLGDHLGGRIRDSARTILSDMVGLSIQHRFHQDDPEFRAYAENFSREVSALNAASPWDRMSEAEAAVYFERVKTYGELNALRWLSERTAE